MKTRKMALVMTMMMTWLTLCMRTKRRIGRRSLRALIVSSVSSVMFWVRESPTKCCFPLRVSPFIQALASHFWPPLPPVFAEHCQKQFQDLSILRKANNSGDDPWKSFRFLTETPGKSPDGRVPEHSWRVLKLEVFGSTSTIFLKIKVSWKALSGLRAPRRSHDTILQAP